MNFLVHGNGLLFGDKEGKNKQTTFREKYPKCGISPESQLLMHCA
jgi:hypothetical protein